MRANLKKLIGSKWYICNNKETKLKHSKNSKLSFYTPDDVKFLCWYFSAFANYVKISFQDKKILYSQYFILIRLHFLWSHYLCDFFTLRGCSILFYFCVFVRSLFCVWQSYTDSVSWKKYILLKVYYMGSHSPSPLIFQPNSSSLS